MRQILFCRFQLDAFDCLVDAPVPAVAFGAKRGQFDDRVRVVEKFAVVADDNRAVPPAGHKVDYRPPTVTIQIVSGLV